MSRRPRVAAAIVLTVVVAVQVVTAVPASAHTLTGVQPTNYRSEILTVAPADRSLRVRLLDLGRRVQVRNRGRTDVVVLGYDGEPYLRVGPRGAFANVRAPMLYRNHVAPNGKVGVPVPREADPAAAPQWDRTGGGRTVEWVDLRTRWDGAAPAGVVTAPRRTQVVRGWSIELLRGPTDVLVTGRIVWHPPPAAGLWLVVALLLLMATVALAASRSWGPALSGVLAVLVAVDVVHSVGTAAYGSTSVLLTVARVVLAGFLSVAAWVAGAGSVGPLQQRREGGVMVAGAAGFVIALLGGVGDLKSLGRSQLAFVYPAVLARAAIAISLGLGLGLVAAAALVERRLFVPERARPTPTN